jgi:hypothetical protein
VSQALRYSAWQGVQRNVFAAGQSVKLLACLAGEKSGQSLVGAAFEHLLRDPLMQACRFAQAQGKVRL